MARTINGNLTGKAAHMTLDERMDLWETPANAIPTDARQDYLDKIEREKEFIAKHPSYISLCEQAQARVKFYQKRIAELERMDKAVERMKGCLVAIQFGDGFVTAAFDPKIVDGVSSPVWFGNIQPIKF